MKLVPNRLLEGLLFVAATLIAVTTVGINGSTAAAQQASVDVYFASQIWPGDRDPIDDAAMVVVDGVITAIGPRDEVSVPATAKRHELGSQILMPGLIVSQTSLGGTQTEERTITPQIRALDGFDFFADRDALIESGITTVQVSPARNRLMPGVGGVVKIAGEGLTDRVLQEMESLQIVLTAASRQPPRIYEPPVGPVSEDRPLDATRPQVATLTASMAALRQIMKAATSGEPSDDEVIGTIAELLKQKTPLRIAASTTPEIRGAISLAKEFDIKVVLTECVGLEAFENSFEGWSDHVAGVVLTAGVPGAITNPSLEQIETEKQPWEFARELIDAGVPVAIAPNSQTRLSASMFVAGQFMRDGLTPVELVAATTFSPAAIMNVGDRVGSLSEGKDADFVVLSGQPFSMQARVRATYVGGKPLFERTMAPATTVVSADRIYVGDGQFLDGGQIVVKGKTIRGVGTSVSAPSDANILQFKDAVIVPGFIDMGTGLGLGGPSSGAITLSTKLGEQLYPDDPAIEYARSNGITTALLVAGSGSNASPVVAFKLGDDARVIGDPVAIKFAMSGSTAAAVAGAERQLAAGKKYVDSWAKYEKDLAEYKVKLAAEEAKAKSDPKPKADAAKKSEKDSDKKDADKKDADKEKEKDKPKPKPDDKKDPEKDKDKDDEKKKKKPLPDPITGSWEGSIDVERIPPQFRVLKFELELAEDGGISGSVSMMGQSIEVASAFYDRESREVSITIERRGQELEIKGKLDAAGEFEGTIELGRLGEVAVTAKRTVDKSKKPAPEEEKDDEEKEEKKDPEKDKDKDKDKDKKESDKKSDAKDADKKKEDAKPAAKPEEKKSALKEPKKPKKVEALEPYKALFAKEIPALVETRDLFSIQEAAKLFSDKYEVRTIIVGGDELARDPDALADHDVSVIAGPKLSVAVPKQIEATNLPQLLANEGLPFAFQSSGTTGSGQLPGAIQYSVGQGLSTVDAIDGLTSAAAKMLSDKHTFGSIAAGNDADMVVLSGSPFEFSTKILAVMIDGVWVYELEEEK